jgi:hypothetical protein
MEPALYVDPLGAKSAARPSTGCGGLQVPPGPVGWLAASTLVAGACVAAARPVPVASTVAATPAIAATVTAVTARRRRVNVFN